MHAHVARTVTPADIDRWLPVIAARARQMGLRWTRQREHLVRLFLAQTRHIAAGELYRQALPALPRLGFATVYRTLNMLVRLGFARELNFEDGLLRYEPRVLKPHHDHLVCIQCGAYVEFLDPDLERLQLEVADAHDFALIDHRFDIFGYCARCMAPSSDPSPGPP